AHTTRSAPVGLAWLDGPSGSEDPGGVKGVFNGVLGRYDRLVQLDGEFMVLDRPDAVFSGNPAAQRNRQHGNIAKNCLGGSVFFWSIVGLHGWMQITIAGVSHDGDGPTVVLC